MSEQTTVIINVDNKFIGQVINKATNQVIFSTNGTNTPEEATLEVNNYLNNIKKQPRRCCGR